jgi:hypothetical protein
VHLVKSGKSVQHHRRSVTTPASSLAGLRWHQSVGRAILAGIIFANESSEPTSRRRDRRNMPGERRLYKTCKGKAVAHRLWRCCHPPGASADRWHPAVTSRLDPEASMSNITDARASARGELNPDPLVVGAKALPSRRRFLGRLAAFSASAFALGAVAGAAGPVVDAAALPAPMEPLSPGLRRYLETVIKLLDREIVRDGSFVAMMADDAKVFFVKSRYLDMAKGCTVLPRDAADQLRAILAADAAGGAHG